MTRSSSGFRKFLRSEQHSASPNRGFEKKNNGDPLLHTPTLTNALAHTPSTPPHQDSTAATPLTASHRQPLATDCAWTGKHPSATTHTRRRQTWRRQRQQRGELERGHAALCFTQHPMLAITLNSHPPSPQPPQRTALARLHADLTSHPCARPTASTRCSCELYVHCGHLVPCDACAR
jgi:hypothetical protein